MTDAYKFPSNKQLSSTIALKRSQNTFDILFKPTGTQKIKASRLALQLATKKRSTRERRIQRYISLLTIAGDNDPFLELFGYIRKKSFVSGG